MKAEKIKKINPFFGIITISKIIRNYFKIEENIDTTILEIIKMKISEKELYKMRSKGYQTSHNPYIKKTEYTRITIQCKNNFEQYIILENLYSCIYEEKYEIYSRLFVNEEYHRYYHYFPIFLGRNRDNILCFYLLLFN
jgi:hypothetical protein